MNHFGDGSKLGVSIQYYNEITPLGNAGALFKLREQLGEAPFLLLNVGVYFFSQAVNEEEAKEEADFVLEHLKGQELQMPVVYDPEHILEDEARTDGVTGEQFTRNAKVFCKEIEEAGYDAMIYSNMTGL